MSSIEQLITPQYIYSNIVEHLRSQLNIGTLNSSELSDFKINEVEIAAFGSRYHFEIKRKVVEDVTPSVLLLSHPPKLPKSVPTEVVKQYVGYLEEVLEPGATRPTFDFKASLV